MAVPALCVSYTPLNIKSIIIKIFAIIFIIVLAIVLLYATGWTPATVSNNTDQQVQIIQLTTSVDDDFFVSWSPDGKKIIFNSINFSSNNYSTKSSGIWVMDSDGSNKVQLLNNTGAGVSEGGVFSPDGTKIAFEIVEYVYGAGMASNSNIWVMNSDGSSPVQLTASGLNVAPRWSPDGKKIVYYLVSSVSGRRDIRVMNSDGTNQFSLTDDLGDASSEFWTPQWSPDGTKIALVSNISGKEDIWIMNSDGSKKKQLTRNEEPYLSLKWSPSGEKIAFRSSHGDLWIMDTDGSRKSLLAEKIFDYSFGPDGTKIAYSDLNNIWIMNSDGSSKTQIVTGKDNFYPVWSPGGRMIAFTSNRNGNLDIWTIELEDFMP